MWKKEMLEKIYEKYQMELSRRDRLDSKSIGYYTILGIFFAAFLVVEPLLFTQGLLLKFSVKELLSMFNFVLMLFFIGIFIVSIFVLHNNYKPKNRPEFDPIENWNVLVSQENEDLVIESIKENLVQIIEEYERENQKTANKLNIINKFCIASGLIIVLIFVVLVTTYYV